MAHKITTFEPTMSARDWATVEAFSRSVVADAAPKTTAAAVDLLTAVSRLALWCHKTAGYPLERPVVFDRDVISEYVTHGCPELRTKGSRGTRRSLLLRVAEAVLPPQERVARLEALCVANPRAPYTPAEQISLRSWAAGQVTAQRRQDCHVLLALGLGAGLSAGEMMTLRVGDIETDDDGVLVHVHGKRDRVVPVLGQWEHALITLRTTCLPDELALGASRSTMNANWVSNFVYKTSGSFKPTSQQMRNTWIVHHLTARTPFYALVVAAGLETTEMLDRLLRFVPRPTQDEVRTALRKAVRESQ